MEKIKCCLCGAEMTHDTSHNPYPVRPESWYGQIEGRCCSDCNEEIVIPARFKLLDFTSEMQKNAYIKILQNTNFNK